MKIPENIKHVLARLSGAGYEACLVGGCVRDYYMGRLPHDFDLATSAPPEAVAALFKEMGVVETGLRHGTVTVLAGGEPVEVTTFRRECGYSDFRRPDAVFFTPSLSEDLARRDFTMNAIALSANGEVQDPFGGRADIAAGLIRCVGDPERRFSEDALRILRALRFAAVLGFYIEPETAEALYRHRELLRKIAPERIFSELCGLLSGRAAGSVLLTYREVLGAAVPELAVLFSCPQNTPYHCFDVWEHTCRVVDETPPVRSLRLAALLHDLGKPAARKTDAQGIDHFKGHADLSARLAGETLFRLRADRALQRAVCTLILEHDHVAAPERVQVHRLLATLGEALFFDLIALQRADDRGKNPKNRRGEAWFDRLEALGHTLLEEGACLTLKDLAVSGEDLLALGFRGPALGQALRMLLAQVTAEVLPNEKKALINYLKNK